MAWTIAKWSPRRRFELLAPLLVLALAGAALGISANNGRGNAAFLVRSRPTALLGSPRAHALTAGASLLCIPTSAHLAGAAGTNWRSDFEAHNPASVAAGFTVALLKRGADNSSPATHSFSLLPGQALRTNDIVSTVFHYSSAAALRITADSGTVLVTSRTYNDQPGGSYGQFVPAIAEGDAIGDAQEGRLIQLSHNPSPTAGFRTNVGYVNAQSSAIALDLALYASGGTLLGTVHDSLRAFEYKQIDKIFERVTSSPVADGYVVITTETQGGRFYAYASVIDNRTGDPICIPAARRPRNLPSIAIPLPSSAPLTDGSARGQRSNERPQWQGKSATRIEAHPIGARALAVPGAFFIGTSAHLSGATGTRWRTDLEIHNPGTTQASFAVALLKRDKDNSAAASQTFSLSPGEAVRYTDVVDAMFHFSGAASLRITQTDGEVLVTSRTYNDQPAGSFGQFVPGATDDDAIAFGEEGRLIQLSHDPSLTAGFRTNVGFVNATASAVAVKAELHAADGAVLGTVSLDLPPWGYKQIDKTFEGVTSAPVADGYAIITTTTAGGKLFAYASVIDNRTGDPIFIPAFRLAAEPPPTPTPTPTVTPTPSPTPSPEPTRGAMGTLEVANLIFSRLLPQFGTTSPSLDDLVNGMLATGPETALDLAVARDPVRRSRIPNGIRADYGSGSATPFGTLSGTLDLVYSSYTSTATGFSLDWGIPATTLSVDGGTRPFTSRGGTLQARVNSPAGGLAKSATAGVSIDITIDESGPGASAKGTVHFDTSVCATYPVSGSVDVTIGDSTTTITFNNKCDGSYDYTVPNVRYWWFWGRYHLCYFSDPTNWYFLDVPMVEENGRLARDVNGYSHYTPWDVWGNVGSNWVSLKFRYETPPNQFDGRVEKWLASFDGEVWKETSTQTYYLGKWVVTHSRYNSDGTLDCTYTTTWNEDDGKVTNPSAYNGPMYYQVSSSRYHH